MKKSLILVLLVLLCGSVHARKYKANGARFKFIDSMVAFRPLSAIQLVYNGNIPVESDSASAIASARQLQVLNHFAERMRLKHVLIISDTSVNLRLRNEIVYLFNNAMQRRFLEDVVFPKTLDSLVATTGVRFALLVANTGFVRSRQNIREANRKNATTSIATLGLFMPLTVRSVSILQVMILDMKEKETYYYNADTRNSISPYTDWNPLEYPTLSAQFYSIFDHFLWLTEWNSP